MGLKLTGQVKQTGQLKAGDLPSPFIPSTWDTADFGGGFGWSFSNNDRNVYVPAGSTVGGIGTASVGSGKWYWEITCVSATRPERCVPRFGICLTSEPNNTISSWYPSSGRQVRGDGNITYQIGTTQYSMGGPYGLMEAGDTYMFALDMDNRYFYAGVNGRWYGATSNAQIAAGTGANHIGGQLTPGFYSPMLAKYTVLNGAYFWQISTNFGQTTFTYTPPEGFNPGI